MFQDFYAFEDIFFIFQDKSTFCKQEPSQMRTKILVDLHNTADYSFLK